MSKRDQDNNLSQSGYESLRAALSAIPTIGGATAILFENVFVSPLDRRKKAWLEELVETIQQLNRKVESLTPVALSENELFISICLGATQIALRTHREEKRRSLLNAITNTALSDIEDDKAMMFLSLIDKYTPLHLLVLDFCYRYEHYIDELNAQQSNASVKWGGSKEVWMQTFASKADESSMRLVDLVMGELQRDGLVWGDNFDHVIESTKTEFGREFLAFITEAN